MLNLKQTKIKLSLIFTLLVFFIIFFLELIFFSVKYLNINLAEKQDFLNLTNVFEKQINNQENFLNFFINEDARFKRDKKEKLDKGPPGIKFVNFLLTDNSGNIVYQSIKEDLGNDIKLDELENIDLIQEKNIYIKKLPLNNGIYKDIILIKKQKYTLEDYFEDIGIFTLINLIFSIVFYILGYIFVNINLKPVEEILNDMGNFIHNANHELKTPISVISSNLQIIKATKTYEEDLIKDSIKEIKIIDNLITSLSELSNISSISKSEDLNLNLQVSEIISELKNIITEKEINISLIENLTLNKKVNKEYFYIFFSNLLRNAIKYNHNKGEIKIIIEKEKISISNTGPGIKEEHIDKIFDRFYKVDNSRNSEGFGIGLSLVKKICDIYNWKISVNSKENGITKFEIYF